MKKILFLFMFLVLFIPNGVFALNEVNVYFFHSKTCDICEQERIYLQALKERYPNMRIYSYEISENDNYNLMQEAKNLFNETGSGVPFTVIADTPFYGFNQGLKGNFQRTVYLASTNKYSNKLGEKLGITYSTDLDGEVEEYKDNADYKIEETVEVSKPTSKKNDDPTFFKKYQSSIILVGLGLILLIIYCILKIFERRGRL